MLVHKDKYYVKEEFGDGVVVEFDEHGAKSVDENTGHTIVPPVIGEPDYRPGDDPKPGRDA